VLEVLLGFVDFTSGRCDPALDTICAKARLARATVVRAIEALKAHGFLDKVRRTRRTGRGPAEGPQREQISNAYAFATRLAATVQQRFAQLVAGRKRAEAIQARKKAEAAERQALLAKPLSGLGSALHPTDPGMARVLNALGAHFDGLPSDGPSASSVTGEYPAQGFKGKRNRFAIRSLMARTGLTGTEHLHRGALRHRRTDRLAPLRGSAGAPEAKAVQDRPRRAFRQVASAALICVFHHIAM
jgi:DNA-binding transcriptional MocR family regulator